VPDAFLGQLSTLSFPPAIAAARMAIVSMMSHSITWGQIRILTADQGIYTFPSAQKREELGLGEVKKDQIADIRVINDTFWFRLVVLADIGFAEAYMAGDCEVSDLVQVFKVSLAVM
jgi:cyclopropane-fatty-acyl-phospholipid synthase